MVNEVAGTTSFTGTQQVLSERLINNDGAFVFVSSATIFRSF